MKNIHRQGFQLCINALFGRIYNFPCNINARVPDFSFNNHLSKKEVFVLKDLENINGFGFDALG